jgi:hypothetical protein
VVEGRPLCRGKTLHETDCLHYFPLLPGSLRLRSRGRGNAVPDWRDASPSPRMPRWSGLGLTRHCCASIRTGELGGPKLLPSAHEALISAASKAVGAVGIMLEDMLPMGPAERLATLSPARPPRNPQDRGQSFGSLVLPGHLAPLLLSFPMSGHWRETRSSPRGEAPSWLLPPGPPSTAARQQRRQNASQWP